MCHICCTLALWYSLLRKKRVLLVLWIIRQNATEGTKSPIQWNEMFCLDCIHICVDIMPKVNKYNLTSFPAVQQVKKDVPSIIVPQKSMFSRESLGSIWWQAWARAAFVANVWRATLARYKVNSKLSPNWKRKGNWTLEKYWKFRTLPNSSWQKVPYLWGLL